ncbi:12138_t:CDS:2, partial [Funneliformis geosporum]
SPFKNNSPARSFPISKIPGHINEMSNNSNIPRIPTPANSAPSSGSHEVLINERITKIFFKIGTREETKMGLYELYEIKKQHPEMEDEISTMLSKQGPYFQRYVHRGLANIAIDEEERANIIKNQSKNHDNTEEGLDEKQKYILRIIRMFEDRS